MKRDDTRNDHPRPSSGRKPAPDARFTGEENEFAHRPIEQCYWVVPGRLLAGEYPRNVDEGSSRDKIDALLRAGVTTFVDLTEEGELRPYTGLIGAAAWHRRFPVRDAAVPESPAVAAAALDAIDRGIEGGGRVYVHCWGGVGRTGVIVGCWLARHGFPGEAALARLRELWRQCPKSRRRPSPDMWEQERYVLRWTEGGRP